MINEDGSVDRFHVGIDVSAKTLDVAYRDGKRRVQRQRFAPGAKETITVTVDGAKAKVGTIDEQLAVTSKKDPSVSATIGVRAVVK